jgi:hypothetical protein
MLITLGLESLERNTLDKVLLDHYNILNNKTVETIRELN